MNDQISKAMLAAQEADARRRFEAKAAAVATILPPEWDVRVDRHPVSGAWGARVTFWIPADDASTPTDALDRVLAYYRGLARRSSPLVLPGEHL